MTGWQIEPTELLRVLNSTEEARDELAAVMTPEVFEDPVSGLGWCPQVTGSIVEALGVLVEAQQEDFAAVLSQVGTGIMGVSAAATVYLDAQTEMDEATRAANASSVEARIPHLAEGGSLTFSVWDEER
ncbi:MAG: DUF6507 family protein [Propionibacteriaceae bacterium]|nr:DUF6507 family protein [Propionibacteriaceae bacterium]